MQARPSKCRITAGARTSFVTPTLSTSERTTANPAEDMSQGGKAAGARENSGGPRPASPNDSAASERRSAAPPGAGPTASAGARRRSPPVPRPPTPMRLGRSSGEFSLPPGMGMSAVLAAVKADLDRTKAASLDFEEKDERFVRTINAKEAASFPEPGAYLRRSQEELSTYDPEKLPDLSRLEEELSRKRQSRRVTPSYWRSPVAFQHRTPSWPRSHTSTAVVAKSGYCTPSTRHGRLTFDREFVSPVRLAAIAAAHEAYYSAIEKNPNPCRRWSGGDKVRVASSGFAARRRGVLKMAEADSAGAANATAAAAAVASQAAESDTSISSASSASQKPKACQRWSGDREKVRVESGGFAARRRGVFKMEQPDSTGAANATAAAAAVAPQAVDSDTSMSSASSASQVAKPRPSESPQTPRGRALLGTVAGRGGGGVAAAAGVGAVVGGGGAGASERTGSGVGPGRARVEATRTGARRSRPHPASPASHSVGQLGPLGPDPVPPAPLPPGSPRISAVVVEASPSNSPQRNIAEQPPVPTLGVSVSAPDSAGPCIARGTGSTASASSASTVGSGGSEGSLRGTAAGNATASSLALEASRRRMALALAAVAEATQRQAQRIGADAPEVSRILTPTDNSSDVPGVEGVSNVAEPCPDNTPRVDVQFSPPAADVLCALPDAEESKSSKTVAAASGPSANSPRRSASRTRHRSGARSHSRPRGRSASRTRLHSRSSSRARIVCAGRSRMRLSGKLRARAQAVSRTVSIPGGAVSQPATCPPSSGSVGSAETVPPATGLPQSQGASPTAASPPSLPGPPKEQISPARPSSALGGPAVALTPVGAGRFTSEPRWLRPDTPERQSGVSGIDGARGREIRPATPSSMASAGDSDCNPLAAGRGGGRAAAHDPWRGLARAGGRMLSMTSTSRTGSSSETGTGDVSPRLGNARNILRTAMAPRVRTSRRSTQRLNTRMDETSRALLVAAAAKASRQAKVAQALKAARHHAQAVHALRTPPSGAFSSRFWFYKDFPHSGLFVLRTAQRIRLATVAFCLSLSLVNLYTMPTSGVGSSWRMMEDGAETHDGSSLLMQRQLICSAPGVAAVKPELPPLSYLILMVAAILMATIGAIWGDMDTLSLCSPLVSAFSVFEGCCGMFDLGLLTSMVAPVKPVQETLEIAVRAGVIPIILLYVGFPLLTNAIDIWAVRSDPPEIHHLGRSKSVD